MAELDVARAPAPRPPIAALRATASNLRDYTDH